MSRETVFEPYLEKQAARPGPTITMTKAAYGYLRDRLAAAEASAGLDVERLAEAMRRIGSIVYSSGNEAEDMCPNCVTPWKCNGPHNLPEREDNNIDEARRLIAEYAALKEQPR